jgi:hypothetical protein
VRITSIETSRTEQSTPRDPTERAGVLHLLLQRARHLNVEAARGHPVDAGALAVL